MSKYTAVIDIGSNSARLVIFERTSRFGFHLVHEMKSRVRIGEGAYENNGILSSESMDRAFLVLQGFKSVILSFKVRKILAVATSALRDAPNKNIFINRVNRELNIQIKVIDGKKEALLGGLACANLIKVENNRQAVTVDIGGGSTEFAIIQNKTVIDTFSLNIGTVRLKELFFDNAEIDPDYLNKAKNYINQTLDLLPREFYLNLVMGIGGTIRALSNLIIKTTNYPFNKLHSFEYNFSEQKELLNSLLFMKKEELEKLGIKKERLDVIQAGTLIFVQILEKLNVQKIITSGVGIREGLFLNDILRTSNYKFPANFNPSLRNLLDRFEINDSIAKQRLSLSLKIFELLKNKFELDNLDEVRLPLIVASKIAHIGSFVDFYEKSKNGYHLVLNLLDYYFTHEEIVLIGFLVRYQKKKRPSAKNFNEFKNLLPEHKIVSRLSYILALSSIFLTTLSRKFSTENISYDPEKNKLIFRTSKVSIHYIEENLKNMESPDLEIKIELIEF
jgi:exopolyphosphatase/guanosine-5'-triphosphate,3'-diphosphate pyrophosphatase